MADGKSITDLIPVVEANGPMLFGFFKRNQGVTVADARRHFAGMPEHMFSDALIWCQKHVNLRIVDSRE